MIDKNEPEKEYYYTEDGKVVFTKEYHLKRGYCCGNGCLHCPYEHQACRKDENKNS